MGHPLRMEIVPQASEGDMKIDNQPVYHCCRCCDTGWTQVIDTRYWPKSLRSVSVVCDCEQGERVANSRINRKWKPVAKLNARMARYTPGMTRDDAADAIRQAMSVENKSNYEPAFADYNQEGF